MRLEENDENVMNEEVPDFTLEHFLTLLRAVGVKDVQSWHVELQKLNYERHKLMIRWTLPLIIISGLLLFGGLAFLLWHGKLDPNVFTNLLSVLIGVGLTLLAQWSKKV